MSSQSQVRSGSFFEILQQVRDQVEIECFDPLYLAQATETCMIIAEVLRLPPTAEIQINGQKMPAAMVQEIYSMLEHEDIQTVMDHFEQATYEIRHIKTYLRTALYNVVFEREASGINKLRKNAPNLIHTRAETLAERRKRGYET